MRKNGIKLLLDVAMLVVVALFYSKNVLGMSFHEVGGLAICGVFVVHVLLNLPWLRAVPRRFFDKTLPVPTKIGMVVNLLLAGCFFTIGLTGIFISKTIFTNISAPGGNWKTVHYFAAGLTVLLLGIHVGLHFLWWKAMLGRLLPWKAKPVKAALAVLAAVVFCFGAYSAATSNLSRWLALPFSAGIQGTQMMRAAYHDDAEDKDDEEEEDDDEDDEDAEEKEIRNNTNRINLAEGSPTDAMAGATATDGMAGATPSGGETGETGNTSRAGKGQKGGQHQGFAGGGAEGKSGMGPKGESGQGISAVGVARQIATYGSMILSVAMVTAALAGLAGRKKKKTGENVSLPRNE